MKNLQDRPEASVLDPTSDGANQCFKGDRKKDLHSNGKNDRLGVPFSRAQIDHVCPFHSFPAELVMMDSQRQWCFHDTQRVNVPPAACPLSWSPVRRWFALPSTHLVTIELHL